ncbi:glycosyltransferase family 2 protein [Sinomonas sp. RB5]
MIVHARPLPADRRPHVAVVVPCYNYGRFLAECVRSIVSQADVTTSVRIIDDASSDDSFTVAQDLAATYPGVEARRHATNQGHIATYNEGLAEVDSDYVVLLSADDQLAPGALSRATAVMEAFPNVGLVYGHPQTFSSTPVPGSDRVRNWSVWPGRRWISAQFSRGLSNIYSPEAVVRTEVHHQVGYYRNSLPHSGDLEMWLRIADVSDVGRVNGPDQAYRRLHSASMMETTFKGIATDLRERFRAYESFLAASRLDPRERRRLEVLARRRVCTEAFQWAASAEGRRAEALAGAAAAVQFAEDVYPDFEDLGAYRVYEASLEEASLLSKVVAARGRLGLEIGARTSWRRWRRYGI